MAVNGIRISQLDLITTIDNADSLPIVDNSETDQNRDTKRITVQQLKTNINAYTKPETDVILNTKVDKVSGKQLSTEDYTTAEKYKLNGIVIPTKTSDLTNDSNFVNQTALNTHNTSNTSHQDIRNLIASVGEGSGISTWGSITGSMTNQTDLTNKFNEIEDTFDTQISNKANIIHTHTTGEVGISYGTTDLIAGTSPLTTGLIYLVYE